ncbi:MAG: hypothetical protein WDN29_12840 [Methylovirgula sp.]
MASAGRVNGFMPVGAVLACVKWMASVGRGGIMGVRNKCRGKHVGALPRGGDGARSVQRLPACFRQRPRIARTNGTAFAVRCKHRSILGCPALLSLAAILTTANVSPSAAGTVDVTDQAGFDAAIQSAITTSQPNSINVTASTLISADTGLVLPGQASPLNLNFVGSAPSFGVGSGSTGSITIGAGTNITFTPGASAALFRVGYGAGSNGTVTMTGGAITGNQSPSNYLSFSMGRDFGTGTFNQSGGTFSLDGGAFQVGVASGQGTYNLSGTGVVNMGTAGTIYLGDAAGGIGTLNVSDSASFTSGITGLCRQWRWVARDNYAEWSGLAGRPQRTQLFRNQC